MNKQEEKSQRRRVFGRSFSLAMLIGIVLFSIILGGFRIAESKEMSKQQEASAKRIEQIEEKLVQLQMQLNMYAEK